MLSTLSKARSSDRVLIDHQNLQDQDFSGNRLSTLSVVGSRFERCSFARSRLPAASFGAGIAQSFYVDCTFDDSDIEFGPAGVARFERCSFRRCRLRDWFCFGVEVVGCVFTGKIEHSVFNGTVPDRLLAIAGRRTNEFHDNDFAGADLSDVSFRTGIDLTRQILPRGRKYLYLANASPMLVDALARIYASDSDVRSQAIQLLNSIRRELVGGQRQLFLRADDYKGIASDAVESVFAALAESTNG